MSRLLLDVLVERFPQASRTTLRQMLADGRVAVDGIVVRSAKKGVPDGVKVTVADRVVAAGPTLQPLEKIYEDDHLLVIAKPAGLLTSTNPRERRPTALRVVQNYLASDRKARVGLIHRLDRDASGLLVFSKSNVAYESLKTQFFKHTVERVYAAVVSPPPSENSGVIDKPLEERVDGTVYVCRGSRGQVARTHFELVRRTSELALLRVSLETGRKHQVRVHLAHRGWPIVGDTVYGGLEAGRLMLCAYELTVDHPATGERLKWTIELPSEITRLLPSKEPR